MTCRPTNHTHEHLGALFAGYRLGRPKFNSQQGLGKPFSIMSILPIRPNQFLIQRVPKRLTANSMKHTHLHAGPISRRCGALPSSCLLHILTAGGLLQGTSLNIVSKRNKHLNITARHAGKNYRFKSHFLPNSLSICELELLLSTMHCLLDFWHICTPLQ
jgi:hypothetical protein